jgi:hypothetical protein
MPDQLIKITTHGFANLDRVVNAEGKRQRKALELAIRRKGYRLRRELQDRIRKGEPAPGHELKPLTFLARGLGIQTSRRVRKNWPLVRFAAFVRYEIEKMPFQMRIGFTGPRVSKKIKDLVVKHEKGFTRAISQALRRYIIAEGVRRGKIEGGRMPYFLKKSTRVFRTPSRPIIGPFWEDVKKDVFLDIRQDFRRKMRGERI